MFALQTDRAHELLTEIQERDPALAELLQIMDRYHVMSARIQAQAGIALALSAITGSTILEAADNADADAVAAEGDDPAMAAIGHETANLLRSINESMGSTKMRGTH
ncbi:hypothetical protein BH10PSE1_BH10PSE1_28310 [soil metagenome]